MLIDYLNKIICDDNLNILSNIEDNCIDIILTSPPYNFDLKYDVYKDNLSINDYLDFLKLRFKEFYRILKPGGRLILNIKPMVKSNYPTNQILTNILISEFGFIWKTEIVCSINNEYKTTWGSWKSPSNPYLMTPFEYVNVYCKESLKHDGLNENIDITKEEFLKYIIGYWDMMIYDKKDMQIHPAPIPKEIVYRCLKLFSYKNDIVLDPFNGIGTTTNIAAELGRRYIGIDISNVYCDYASNKLKKYEFFEYE